MWFRLGFGALVMHIGKHVGMNVYARPLTEVIPYIMFCAMYLTCSLVLQRQYDWLQRNYFSVLYDGSISGIAVGGVIIVVSQ